MFNFCKVESAEDFTRVEVVDSVQLRIQMEKWEESEGEKGRESENYASMKLLMRKD